MRPPAQLVSKEEKDKPVVAWAVDVVRAIKELQDVPLLNGVLLEDVSVGMSDTTIQHKLGRVPRGYLVVKLDAGSAVWQPAAATSSHIHLQAASDVVISLWVF